MTDQNGSDVRQAYSCQSIDELKQFYDGSAHNYDSYVKENGYVLPRKVALKASLSLTGGPRSVLDVGCGTGLLGPEIRSLRPSWELTGVDISAEMLKIAEHRADSIGNKYYKTVMMADMTRRHSFMQNSFDVLISAGTFTPNHLGPEHLTMMLDYLKTHGCVFISVNLGHFRDTKFDEKLDILHRSKKITEPSFTETAAWHNSLFDMRAVIVTFCKA